MTSRALALAIAALAAVAATPARAQVWLPAKGEGDVTATWQTVTDHYHLNWEGDRISAGKIRANSVQLRLDYGFADRWAVSVTAPFISKRYQGPVPHNPDPYNPDDDHPDDGHEHEDDDHEHIGVLDDGDYHGGWQDWGVGVRWKWRKRPWALTPFVAYSQPASDYVYFAHAARGTQQKRLALGLAFGRQFGPRWPRWYTQGSYSYTFVEEVLDISVDYSTVNLETGYFFTPKFSARVFATYRKTHGGLDFPIDFPSRTDELFLHHDQVQRVDYLNYGIGASYRLGDRYGLSFNWLTTGWGENGHAVHNAVSLGISRSF